MATTFSTRDGSAAGVIYDGDPDKTCIISIAELEAIAQRGGTRPGIPLPSVTDADGRPAMNQDDTCIVDLRDGKRNRKHFIIDEEGVGGVGVREHALEQTLLAELLDAQADKDVGASQDRMIVVPPLRPPKVVVKGGSRIALVAAVIAGMVTGVMGGLFIYHRLPLDAQLALDDLLGPEAPHIPFVTPAVAPTDTPPLVPVLKKRGKERKDRVHTRRSNRRRRRIVLPPTPPIEGRIEGNNENTKQNEVVSNRSDHVNEQKNEDEDGGQVNTDNANADNQEQDDEGGIRDSSDADNDADDNQIELNSGETANPNGKKNELEQGNENNNNVNNQSNTSAEDDRGQIQDDNDNENNEVTK